MPLLSDKDSASSYNTVERSERSTSNPLPEDQASGSAGEQLATASYTDSLRTWTLTSLKTRTGYGNSYDIEVQPHSATELTLSTIIRQRITFRMQPQAKMDGLTIAATLAHFASNLRGSNTHEIVEQFSSSFSRIASRYHKQDTKSTEVYNITQTSCLLPINRDGLESITIYFDPELSHQEMQQLVEAVSPLTFGMSY